MACFIIFLFGCSCLLEIHGHSWERGREGVVVHKTGQSSEKGHFLGLHFILQLFPNEQHTDVFLLNCRLTKSGTIDLTLMHFMLVFFKVPGLVHVVSFVSIF